MLEQVLITTRMEEETKRTDKELLTKGLQRLGICLLLMFIGPSFLYFVMSNEGRAFYVPLLIIDILICIAAILFLFLGIRTIMNSMFGKR